MRLIRRADDGKGEADPVERTIACYRFAGKLRRWANNELKTATSKQPLRVVRVTINAQMLDVLKRQPEAKHWSKRKWAEHLGCSAPGIGKTDAWEAIMATRAEAKRE